MYQVSFIIAMLRPKLTVNVRVMFALFCVFFSRLFALSSMWSSIDCIVFKLLFYYYYYCCCCACDAHVMM